MEEDIRLTLTQMAAFDNREGHCLLAEGSKRAASEFHLIYIELKVIKTWLWVSVYKLC